MKLVNVIPKIARYFTPNARAKLTVGQCGEAQALDYLTKQGLTLFQKNYYCKAGEIDLIMLDNKQWVFIEVRVRNQETFGGALESITLSKRKKIIRCALYFLQRHKAQRGCRFDVVAINQQRGQVQWIKQAFSEDGY